MAEECSCSACERMSVIEAILQEFADRNPDGWVEECYSDPEPLERALRERIGSC